MKTNTLININKNPAYAEQLATLAHLEQSLVDTRAEIAACDAKLATIQTANGIQDKVADVLAMLSGKAPVMSGRDDVVTQRATAEHKAILIKQAMEQQRASMNALYRQLSADASKDMQGEHAEAVRAIATALKALDMAYEAEETVRDRIEQAGYGCTLPFYGLNELGRMKLPLSPMVTHYRACTDYVADSDDHISGKLDKAATVHLLIDMPGVGHASEVISMEGRTARALWRAGRAEPTTDKPRRLVKHNYYQEGVRE